MILDLEVVDAIKNILDRFNYKRIKVLPTIKSFLFPFNDIANMIKFFRNGDNSYTRILFPSVYEYMIKSKDRDLYILFNLLFKNFYVKSDIVEALLGKEYLTLFLKKGIFRLNEGLVYSLIKISPYGRFYFISTAIPFYKDFNTRVYIGGDSFLLANDIRRYFKDSYYEKGLDLCCGSGIQSLNLSEFTGNVTGFDINPNAILFATNNALLNNKDNVKFVLSDMYQNADGKYDIIVSNPPFGFLPDNLKNWLPGFGGELGMEIPLKIIEGFKRYLSDKGVALICLASPVVNGRDLLIEKLREMFYRENFSIKAKVIEESVDPIFKDLHREKGINYFKYYHIFFKKGEKYSLSVQPLPPGLKIQSVYGIIFSKLLGLYNPCILKKQDIIYKKLLSNAKSQLSLGNMEKAKEDFKKILTMRPYDMSAHLELGDLYIRQGKPDIAENYFHDSIALFPSIIEPYCQLGGIYKKKKDKDKAIEYLKKAVELTKEIGDKELEIGIKKWIRSIRTEKYEGEG